MSVLFYIPYSTDELPDRHLPFSLLHERQAQYRFSGEPSSSRNGTVGPSAVDAGLGVHDHMSPGFHHQVVFDLNCQRILPESSSFPSVENTDNRDNCIYRDNCIPRDIPEYDMPRILELLQSALHERDVGFWAQVLYDHRIEATTNDVDSFRIAFVKHLFSGACVSQIGPGCRLVVTNEQSLEIFGINMIDATLDWVDKGVLTLADYSVICSSLEITTTSSHKKRALHSAMSNRRRLFLNTLDALDHSLKDLVPSLGTTSSVKLLRSVGAAHGLKLSPKESKDDTSSKLLQHVTQGDCVKNVEGSDYARGCARLTKEADLRNLTSVALQVFVIRHIIDTASRKLLIKTLEIHEIAYDPDYSTKKLRACLTKFVTSIERGKLKEIDDEHSAMERLRKLDEVRANWPRPLPALVKEHIVKDFRAATSSTVLASFTCACCARATPMADRVRKRYEDVNLDLLEGPSRHWNDATFPAPPTPFTEGPLKNKLVDKKGVTVEGDTIVLDMCNSCSRGLYRRSLPKHSLANKIYVGPVPEVLEDLTMVEESMIALARAKSWIVKLQEQNPDTAAPTSQRGLRGHTIIYPQTPDKLATLLPPSVGETLTYICVIFVGRSEVTKTWLRDKAKPLVVRREKVRNALIWLKENNPLYKDLEISEENLDALPNNDVLPYHIERVESDDAQEVLVSRYDNSAEEQPENETESRFESVVVTDVDAHTPVNQLRAAAVRHVKTNGKSFIRVGHGSKPVNEFFNVDLFPMLYPTLYPYGCGGFEDRDRKKAISMKEHVKALFTWDDKRFQTHYSFLFTVFNMLQRRALLLGCSLKVKKTSFDRFAKQFSSVSSQSVARVLEKVERGEKVAAETDEDKKVLRLMKEVNLVTSKVPGSSASRVAMRNEIRALTMTHGMPSFYLTINPADCHNPIVKFLAGEEIDLENMLEDQIPKYWEQAVLLSTNPTIGAKFFNQYLKAFVRTVLGYREDGTGDHDGVLGTVKAHYGCVEAQGRGSLHCHMLVWVEGALNPNEIRERVIQDPEWGKILLDYLDNTITNIVPEDPIPDKHAPWEDRDPCTLRGVNLEMDNIEERIALRMKDCHYLAERVQRHRHSHTCYKYYRAGEERTCRFDLKEENFQSESCIDGETGQINLRCLDGLVNNFNMTILEAVRCNMDIQFIGSGASAKAMIYYITDYITKSQLKSHIAYAALQMAVKKCEGLEDEDDDFTVRSKRLLQKCAYALISHQEMSAQQVASYLMDYEDHFASHSFSHLYWAAFERYIEASDVEKLFPRTHASEIDETSLDHTMTQAEEGEVEERMVEETREENEEVENSVNADEEVVIHVESDGNVIALTDQVTDYTLRPRELSSFCLWDFVSKTEKLRGRIQTEDDGGDSRMDEGDIQNTYESDCEEEDMSVGCDLPDISENRLAPRGRKKVNRYCFLDEHVERDKKHIKLRARPVVPVPIGPAVPRRDEVEKYSRYCRLMLILFKPWRSVGDLRDQTQSWDHAFSSFRSKMDSQHTQIMDNMQVLHECRDS